MSGGSLPRPAVVGWWACQDLNLGPRPYHQSRSHRHAILLYCMSFVPSTFALGRSLVEAHGVAVQDPRGVA
jgi:hypothetical protein